jgi:hypothetical protein
MTSDELFIRRVWAPTQRVERILHALQREGHRHSPEAVACFDRLLAEQRLACETRDAKRYEVTMDAIVKNSLEDHARWKDRQGNDLGR